MIGVFFAVTWLPLAVGVLEPDAAISPTEQRTLAAFPSLEPTLASAMSLPERFEKYFDDRLGLRLLLIRAGALLRIGLLGVSPSPSLVIGKEGWLFYGDPRDRQLARGVALQNDAGLRAWQAAFEARRDWLSERGIAYLVVLVPNKHILYPEYLPDSLPRIGETNKFAQLADHLARHSDVAVIDLTGPLLDARRKGRVFHKTDTHWNDRGAYRAYLEILDAVAKALPDATLTPIEVTPRERTTAGLGLARIVGLAGIYTEEQQDLVPVRRRSRTVRETDKVIVRARPDAALPRAVMFRDSFANALIPYLSESFSRIAYVWTRDVKMQIVERERPDIVIHEISARFVGSPPDSSDWR